MTTRVESEAREVLELGREPSFELDGYPPAFVPAAYAWHPPRAGSYGPLVARFGERIGHPLDLEQQADVDVLASHDAAGLYVAGETCVVEGRRNGKTDREVLPLTLFDWLLGSAQVVDWTSHLMATTLKTKAIVDALIASSPLLRDRVDDIVDARGSEQMVQRPRNGERQPRRWFWSTRSEGQGRGGDDVDVWVADEALYLTVPMVGARRPAMRVRPGAQMRLASSAGLRRSRYLAAVVARGRAGGDPGLAYVERCAPGGFDGSACADGSECSHVFGVARGCALDDESSWHLANHALARGRIAYRKLRDERRSLTGVEGMREFARETAGWHEPVDGDDDATVDVATWDRFEDRSSAVLEGRRPDVFVVGVRADQAGSSIAVAGPRVDGRTHVGLIRHGDLVGQRLVDEVLELRRRHRPRRIVVLPGPASSSVAELLKRRMPRLEVASQSDVAAAAGDLLAGIRADDFRHLGDRHVRAALEAAPPRRTSDGGWSFDTRAGGDVLPIVAVVVARWRARQLKAYDPGRSFG